MIRKARLIKRITKDCMVEVRDSIVLGKEYLIYDDTIQLVNGHNLFTGKDWTRLMVKVIDDGAEAWFPMELLELLEFVDQGE